MTRSSAIHEVFTAEEAARYLRVSKATVLRLAHRGRIVGVRIGRQWRFSKKTISELPNHPELLKSWEAE